MLSRHEILNAITTALEPKEYVQALWEGGAAAFDRVDQWSDIDLMIAVDDDHVAETFDQLEACLRSLSPIARQYNLPEPAWHGHSQRFYQLQEASPFLMLDVVVLKRSSENKFLQPELHGDADVHFDKSGVVQTEPFDWPALKEKLRARLETLRVNFDLFQTLTLKEIERGNAIEALGFYLGFTLRPLVEALRIRYRPARHSFHTRYVYYDLPADAVKRLEDLYFVAGLAELRDKQAQAERWFDETLAAIDLEAIISTET
jgi:hypothetical protein